MQAMSKKKVISQKVKKTWIVSILDKFTRIYTAKEIAYWKREDRLS